MRLLRPTTAGFLSALRLWKVLAISNITFYSDDQCSKLLSVESGPDDGTCTQFSEIIVSSFKSFRVTSLDQTCAVTVYGDDVPYCSSNIRSIAGFTDCLTNATVNQFSVDCQDTSIATASAPSVLASSTTVPTSSSNQGLSGGAKAGIAIAAAVGGVIFITLLVFLVIKNNRKKKQEMEEGILEADSRTATLPPYSSELPPDEKRRPVELPPQCMIPVEAPGDEKWPVPQELEGDTTVQSEMEGSQPSEERDIEKEVLSDFRDDIKKTRYAGS